MNIRKIAAGAGVAAIAMGAAMPAAALNVNTNTDTNVTGSVGVTGTGSSHSGNAAGSVNAAINADINATTGVNGSGSSTSYNNGNASVTGNVTGNTDISGSVSDDTLMITRADIETDGVDSASWSSRSASDVKSSADLKGYVASQIKNDDNISAVESSASDVAVTYKQRGRFLGFIPVTVKATAMVDQNGQVTVKYPWYTFLTATDRADLQAKLQASVDAMISGSAAVNGMGNTSASATGTANANANAAMKFSADTQARIISEMRRIMGEELTASANASANADASAGNNR